MKKTSLEDNFARIDEIMDKLSKDDVSLEESFGLYKEGMELVKSCSEAIDKVEKEIILLRETSDTSTSEDDIYSEDFEESEDEGDV